MKRWITPVLVLLVTLLTACTPMIYGVPEERWATMSEKERLVAMEIYKERQVAAREAAAERARLRAIEAERQAAREAAKAKRRRALVDAIYRGEGNYGDLLRVTIREGSLKIGGKRRAYVPMAFKIAEGESKKVVAASSNGRRADLGVSYLGGTLVIDDYDGRNYERALRLVYDQEWAWGKTYDGVSSEGPLRLRQAEVYVEIVGRKAPARRSPTQPEGPAVVIIREKSVLDNDPPVIVIESRAQHPGSGKAEKNEPPGLGKPPAKVRIRFLAGEVRVNGKYRPLKPQAVVLKAGQTRRISLKTERGSVKLGVSYRDGAVAVEDIPADGRRKTRVSALKFNRNWKTGQTYRISTGGEMQIRNADIEVIAAD